MPPESVTGASEHTHEMQNELYARETEVKDFNDLQGMQRGTTIPALFNQFYKYLQNPSSVSIETFKRMVDTDDTIGSGVDFLTICMAARLGRYQHESTEITEWVNKALDRIEGGFFGVKKQLLSGTWAGFAVGEKSWANTEMGFIIDRLPVYPPSTILFEADRTGALTEDGILQYQRNYNPLALQQGLSFFGGVSGTVGFSGSAVRPDIFAKLGDLPFPMRTANSYNYLSVRIPKLKCVHFAFDAQGQFGNPYGRSLLRRAYKYYILKDAILQMLAVALDRKGSPLTIIFANQNTMLKDPDKVAQGQNPRGRRDAGMTAGHAAKKAFENIHNDTTIILPGKKGEIFDAEFVNQVSNAGDFIEALNFCNKSIMRALLIPALIFGDGDGAGSFALAETHAKTFDKILDGSLAGFEYVLIQQLVRELVCYNFPRSAWEKDGFGSFSEREMSQDEVNKTMELYEKAIDKGVVDQTDLNDLNKMRDTIGFEPVEEPIEMPNPLGITPGEDGNAFEPGGPDDTAPDDTTEDKGE